MTAEPLATYFDDGQLPLPYCPGCGHSIIINKLNDALVRMQLDPKKVVIVTDIGCVGLSDRYFLTNAFHGLHGRSVTYATGIKLANPELEVIVLMGDGACGIGGHHLINAARRNIAITVLVFNNLNYGMTGGEHSVTTPPGAKTSTTLNNIEQPMDVCGTVAINGAAYVARMTAYEKLLTALIESAVRKDGFSLIDIWELCTAYYVPNNRFSKILLEDSMESLGFKSGVIVDIDRPEFSRALRESRQSDISYVPMSSKPIEQKYGHQIQFTEKIIIAGAAGTKVASAASALCRGGIMSGLYATQRNDHMVTVKSGYSIAEVILSTEPINYTTITKPDRIIVPFSEGFSKIRTMIESQDGPQVLYINSSLLPIQTAAKVYTINFQNSGKKKEYWSTMAIAEMLRQSKIYPIDAFVEALAVRKEFAEANIEAVRASSDLLQTS